MDDLSAGLDVPAIRARIEQRFRVYDVHTDEHVVAFFVHAAHESLEGDFEALKRDLKQDGLLPLLKYQGGEHAIYVLRNPTRTKRSWKVNVWLYLITILTTTLAGAYEAFGYYHSDFDLSQVSEWQYHVRVLTDPSNLLLGFVTFALPLMAILTIHEFGHYVAARRHGVDASLPFFIPVPPVLFPTGTMGAFIAMREPMPNRKALFDIGAAGPLAGFVVALVVLLLGFVLMAVHPVAPPSDGGHGILLGEPLLFQGASKLFGLGDDVMLHPTAFAAWVGLFVTAMNLIPVGQLDGGHIATAMFGERGRYVSYAAVVGLLGLGLAPMLGFGGSGNWLVLALLVSFMGVRHPPTLDGVSGLDTKRQVIGWATFVIGVLCFTIVPFAVN
ncbi:MAG: hypothetical protein QOE90_1313 [Thermoplasmata archaeon]|nr:hypothetical protein [Thermoplasmata archaeon]